MIYIITHKIFSPYFYDNNYVVLHVGSNNSFKDSYLRDNTGDNISLKNPNYCELTGLYWIWKNGKERLDEITGIVHYRRYFTNTVGDLLYTYLGVKPKILDYHTIEIKLKQYDIILPKSEKIFRTVRQSYIDVHNEQDLILTRKAIEKVSPEYLDTFDMVMNSHKYYYANMMICNKHILNKYSEWLFNLFKKLETLIDLNKYKDNYQSRVYGFLSERLLQVWVIHNKLKIYEFPVFNTEVRRDTCFKKNKNRITNGFNKLFAKKQK